MVPTQPRVSVSHYHTRTSKLQLLKTGITAQATRVRRETIDFAAKVVRHSGQTVLKVTAAIWERLKLPHLWDRAARPPRMAPT